MSCYVRPMCEEDVAQVTEIDRAAFPSQWPPPNYKHELRNRLARYIVVCDDEKTVEQPEVRTSSNGLTGFFSRLKQLFSRNRFSGNELPSSSRHYVIGFTGFWIMSDEAHISTIAVREAYRRQGLGELLLLSVISLAVELKVRIVTLEVRVSNTVAQNLYTKYGFTQVGVRRGYYTDNREDGLLMSTQDIHLVEFQTHFQQLKQAHSGNVG